MKIIILWKEENTKELLTKVKLAIDDLWLTDFIELTSSNDSSIKDELNIKKEPALIIEEEAIDFKDTIFEWITPEDSELKSMLISIIWWNESWWCDPNSWCNLWCC